MICSASIFASICSSIFNAKWLPKRTNSIPGNHPFGYLFATFFEDRFISASAHTRRPIRRMRNFFAARLARCAVYSRRSCCYSLHTGAGPGGGQGPTGRRLRRRSGARCARVRAGARFAHARRLRRRFGRRVFTPRGHSECNIVPSFVITDWA